MNTWGMSKFHPLVKQLTEINKAQAGLMAARLLILKSLLTLTKAV
jgi:hypothetical protein